MRQPLRITRPTPTVRNDLSAVRALSLSPRPATQPPIPVRPYGFLNPGGALPAPQAEEINPYVDFSSYFTAEGGILISSGRPDSFWPILLWFVLTLLEAWLVTRYDIVDSAGGMAFIILVLSFFAFVLVAGSPEKQTVEIRPDCMIVDGKDVFWRKFMENGWPQFHGDPNGDQKLSGIYGTRFIEYLTLTRSDEFDRTPEVFGLHLRQAMDQLWNRPI